jgi:hypothetical protein
MRETESTEWGSGTMEDRQKMEHGVIYRSHGATCIATGRFVSTMTESDRFDGHVDRSDPQGCHPWTGSQTADGYPRFRTRARWVRSHRWAYERAYGPIPEGLTVDHVRRRGCTTRLCVNPAHLEAVPNPTNVARSHEPIGALAA